ncbi:MAG: DUF4381 domain-containing protein [Spirochaetes bacterium]|nr:DUF4381 domain-containing protein [Spirochaetota bacterium]
MKMKLLAIMMLAAITGLAGEVNAPKIRATVTPEKATVGTILVYKVTIAGKDLGGITIVPPEKREVFPEKKKAQAIPKKEGEEEAEEDPAQYVPLYVIHSIKKDDRSDKAMTDITVTMQISFYRPGAWQLPDVEIKGSDGIAIGYKTPSVTIGAVNEKGEFEEVEPPLALGGNWWRLVILILVLAVLGVVGFFAWRHIRKRIEERRTAPVIVPPIDIFLKEIEQFNGDRLIEDGRIEDFVFGISMIFRKYLSLQFHFDAAEMTTYEIEKKIKKVFPRNIHDAHAAQIMDGFNLWDLSKFAEFTPSPEHLRASLGKTVDVAKKISGAMSGDTTRV